MHQIVARRLTDKNVVKSPYTLRPTTDVFLLQTQCVRKSPSRIYLAMVATGAEITQRVDHMPAQ